MWMGVGRRMEGLRKMTAYGVILVVCVSSLFFLFWPGFFLVSHLFSCWWPYFLPLLASLPPVVYRRFPLFPLDRTLCRLPYRLLIVISPPLFYICACVSGPGLAVLPWAPRPRVLRYDLTTSRILRTTARLRSPCRER